MADFIFNQAKGKFAEWAVRVNNNDPTNSIFGASLWNMSETDATNKDLDTTAALEAAGSNAELTSGTNANYARKVLDNTSGITITIDDTADATKVDIADQTWVGLGAGTAVTDFVLDYDSDSTAGTDSNRVPVSQHDFAITPDGSDVTAQIHASGVWQAS